MIESVYLLLNDGRCIFSKSYRNSEIDPHLLGGLLNAFNIASNQWLKEGVRKFVSEEGKNFILQDFSSFLVVIAGNLDQDEEIVLEKIGMRFLSKFGDKIDKWSSGNVGIIKDFEQDLNKILNISDFPKNTTMVNKISNPDEPYLDSLTIISLPKDLQKTALALLTLRNANIEEISRETQRNSQDELRFVDELIQLGYILKKQIGSKVSYYIP